jgi:hypothetical protein
MKLENVRTLDDWQKVTGKRFRLYKDEKERGLNREQALTERIAALTTNKTKTVSTKTEVATQPKRASRSRKGDILIRIRPESDVDSEFFSRLPKGQTEVVLDQKWYGWFNSKLDMPYDGNIEQLLRHVLDLGIGEVAGRYQFPEDLNE